MKNKLTYLKLRSIVLISLFYVAIVPGNAQMKTDHLPGDAGLQSGTQAPPSIIAFIPFYNFHTSTFKNKEGNSIGNPDLNVFFTGIGGSIVTNFKLLHGNWEATVLVPFSSNRIDGGQLSSKSSLAFTDIYVQPVQLGWHTKQADFTAGYALYLPTGKYSLGGDDNTGLGMLTNEFSGGTTLYFDKKKEWHFSALFSYALNGAKKNTKDNDIKPGNVLTIEGGLGKTWYKPIKGSEVPMVINGGLVYYIQSKITDDKIEIPVISGYTFDLSKDHVYALGAEANILFPKTFTSLSIRWLGELGAKNRFQGNTFFITLAQFLKSLEKKKK
jgi:hypothetical protein